MAQEEARWIASPGSAIPVRLSPSSVSLGVSVVVLVVIVLALATAVLASVNLATELYVARRDYAAARKARRLLRVLFPDHPAKDSIMEQYALARLGHYPRWLSHQGLDPLSGPDPPVTDG